MKGLYHILKPYENDFLDLRDKFCLGEDIGFGSFPLHHHWEEDSMPFVALPVQRSESGELKIEAVSHWFPAWHEYTHFERNRVCGLRGTTLVMPFLADEEQGYVISAYMYRAFINPYEVSGHRGIDILHPAFLRMPREVFRGGLSLTLGSLISETEVPEGLKRAFYEVPYPERDEALTFGLYVGERDNVTAFLKYWEEVLEKYFLQTTPPKIDSRCTKFFDVINASPEFVAARWKSKRSLQEGEAQLIMLQDIRKRLKTLKI